MIDDEYLFREMATRRAAVVHFSHHAIMAFDGPFPEDLEHAIAVKDSEARSCCVVWPGHAMDLPGSVGVVFDVTVENVISVFPNDSGSFDLGDGMDASNGVPLTKESFDQTFQPTGPYNEWRVRGAQVKGIFVSDPNHICAKRRFVDASWCRPSYAHVDTVRCEEVSVDFVRQSFPKLRLLKMTSDGLVDV